MAQSILVGGEPRNHFFVPAPLCDHCKGINADVQAIVRGAHIRGVATTIIYLQRTHARARELHCNCGQKNAALERLQQELNILRNSR